MYYEYFMTEESACCIMNLPCKFSIPENDEERVNISVLS